MRVFNLLSIHFILFSSLALGQCNGDMNVCDKRFDEVAYLTTHNSYNAQSEGFTFPNQNYSLTQQLHDGVRGFMIDVYDLFGTPTVYHGSSILGTATFLSNLLEIRQFLDNNPNEIVSIILECYVDANTIESSLNTAGLSNYLYTKLPSNEWATLNEMISNNKRLVIFSDVDDASPTQLWYHYVWDLAVETHYSVNNIGDFTNDYNRGEAWNDLFIFNHFVTDATLGIGIETSSAIVNGYTFLYDRIEQHYAEKAKFPNFITLDFYDLGDGKQVVDSLNANLLTLDINDDQLAHIEIYPNPASNAVNIVGLPSGNNRISILNSVGQTIMERPANSNDLTVDLKQLNSGIYFIKVENDIQVLMNKKLYVD